ncbi:MAG: hypothetical protein KDK39_11900 [Leptospiraceae bacterium]|nr:hypothetical protein [Leptospiraceae bacterium]
MATNEIQPVPADTALGPLLKDTLHYCFLGSLCPLIPLPFLDDWALNFMQRKLILKAGQRRSVPLSETDLKLLTQGYEEPHGCLLNLILMPVNMIGIMIIRPSKRLLRKFTIVLAVKEAADMFSRFLHHAVLTDYAAHKGYLDPPIEATSSDARTAAKNRQEQLLRVSRAVNIACNRMDTRPINQAIRRVLAGSRTLIAVSLTAFTGWIRKARRAMQKGQRFDEEFDQRISAGDQKLEFLIQQLTAELVLRADYFDQVLRSFETQYAAQNQE